MIKLISQCHPILHSNKLIRVNNYCSVEKLKVPTEIKIASREGIKTLGNISVEKWEPGIGPTEVNYFPSKKQIKYAVGEIKKEFRVWVEEMKEGLKYDPHVLFPHGEIKKIWTFEKENSLKDFAFTNDSEQEFGYSTCTVTRTSNGTLLFKGNLSTDIRDDGVTTRSGFCGFRTPRAMKSFRRKWFYDWGMYTHVVLKVRGDGRYYLINLGQDDLFDHTWYDMQSYFLFTRGGPYWQTVKIPFSKFVFVHKGKIQDYQPDVEPTRITFLGITLMDGLSGPFQLEIEYIGAMYDCNHTEESAYESYDSSTSLFSA